MIDYSKIAKAKDYYESLGYKYIEVPWLVYNGYQITMPPSSYPHRVECGWNYEGCLVGSGEQGFVELMLNGKLKQGRYQTITPCFRDDEEDELHQQYFMKLELIDYMPKDVDVSVTLMSGYAYNFMCQFFNNWIQSEYVGGDNYQVDILSPNLKIELGSYGIRQFSDHKWVFGTGLALPRLDIAIQKENEYGS